MICPECGSNSLQFKRNDSKAYWDCGICGWQVEIRKAEAAKPKLVSMAAHGDTLLALDSEGVVWEANYSAWKKSHLNNWEFE